MSFNLTQLFFIGLGYLLLLFGIAHITERGFIPDKLLNHPVTYILSLGVFASAWAIYGVVGLANQYGYGFLYYYLGLAGAFMFAPLVLQPLLRISKTFLHSSLADVLTFRYRSQTAGSLITLTMLIAILPLLALQIQAVSDTVIALTSTTGDIIPDEDQDHRLALIFCLVITVFTISFGSKHLTAHERHNGLVVAIAFESIVKLLALSCVGMVALFTVFGGLGGLESWLDENQQMVSLLNFPMEQNSARSLLLIFFSAAVAMPHLFHMIFAENPSQRALNNASWGLPLFLLLMSLPILPILWAGYKLETDLPPEYFTLGIGIELESKLLTTITFIGGLSAASGAIIVTTLAMASMCLKHLILPIYRPSGERDIYRWLLWIRRVLMIFIIFTGYLFFRVIVGRETLSALGMAAFIATLQFLPGILATLYWQKANKKGFISGLIAGFTVWFFMLLLPIISDFNPQYISKIYFGIAYEEVWNAATIISLGLNTLIFTLVSLVTKTSDEERASAELCSTDDINRPTRKVLGIQSPEEMTERLATAIGKRTATREVGRALEDLKMTKEENRPFALRRLRYRVEANLSGLLGPSVANDMINQLMPYDSKGSQQQGEDINLIEVQLENYKMHLTGLAADLDNLRRYHRETLQYLPVGVCSLGNDKEILMWNDSIAKFTGISTFDVIGSHLSSLPEPWGSVLNTFSSAPEAHQYKQPIEVGDELVWINLHKASRGAEKNTIDSSTEDAQVIVLEDATAIQMLEKELTHSERLASIGRLAAGVAHEIGNPITSIACLAQNLQYDTKNPESLTTADEILSQTGRVSKIVQTLVNFAHSGSEDSYKQHQAVLLRECVDEAIHLLELNTEAKPIEFINQCMPDSYVLADGQRLLQVFVNLLSNARDASEENGTVTVTAIDHGNKIAIKVIDEGSGISEKDLGNIFEPFFTTKDPGEGTGLGLAMVYSIVSEFNGNIHTESPYQSGHGTCFTVTLQSADPNQ